MFLPFQAFYSCVYLNLNEISHTVLFSYDSRSTSNTVRQTQKDDDSIHEIRFVSVAGADRLIM